MNTWITTEHWVEQDFSGWYRTKPFFSLYHKLQERALRRDGRNHMWAPGREVPLPLLYSWRELKVELAMTGEVWNAVRQNSPKEVAGLPDYIHFVGWYMPFNKVLVISTFIELGRVTLMCGDGGNDCSVLKMVHKLNWFLRWVMPTTTTLTATKMWLWPQWWWRSRAWWGQWWWQQRRWQWCWWWW
jgi:hypothetical protein